MFQVQCESQGPNRAVMPKQESVTGFHQRGPVEERNIHVIVDSNEKESKECKFDAARRRRKRTDMTYGLKRVNEFEFVHAPPGRRVQPAAVLFSSEGTKPPPCCPATVTSVCPRPSPRPPCLACGLRAVAAANRPAQCWTSSTRCLAIFEPVRRLMKSARSSRSSS